MPLIRPAQGFAVFDFETTGLNRENDRAIEIAVVHVSPDGVIEGEWDTLIKPGASTKTGAQFIHKIAPSDVAGAPQFFEIIPQLDALFSYRTVVAHNKTFDLKFLAAEYERAGFSLPAGYPSLCTMALSKQFRKGAKTHKLAIACADYGINLSDAHEALADTRATAELLVAFLHQDRDHAGIMEALEQAKTAWWPAVDLARTPRWTRADARR